MAWVCRHSSGWCNEYNSAETGLYYLGSRYYDPEVGRFINADDVSVIGASPMELTDKNLFAYCDNNPVMRKDDGGQIWNIIIGAAVGGLIGGIIYSVTQCGTTGDFSLGRFAVAVGAGAVSGALAATGIGIIGQIACNGTIGAVSSGLDNAFDKTADHDFSGYAEAVASGAVLGVVSGALGGPGSGTKNMTTMGKGLLNSIKSGKPFKNAVKYWYRQTAKEAVQAGKRAIPSICKSSLPSISKSAYDVVSYNYR